MPLLECDAYEMMRRFVDPAREIVFLDVGANTGQTCRRVRDVFPRARICAFEPSARTCETLRNTALELGNTEVIQAAVGQAEGWCELVETENSQFSSVLKATDAGIQYHASDIREVARSRVPAITLDGWARTNAINRVDMMKIDVQGSELDVLRGAAEILHSGHVRAINCEAQIVPEYAGAATLTDIDLMLRGAGFVIHQFHEVWAHGQEQQHSCVDALWIRADVLEWLREDPRDAYKVEWKRVFADVCMMLSKQGARHIALYGAGEHTRVVVDSAADNGVRVGCIIDDDTRKWGSKIHGVEVMGQQAAINLGIHAAVLSSNVFEHHLWNASAELRELGVPVIPLYGRYDAPVNARTLAASSRM